MRNPTLLFAPVFILFIVTVSSCKKERITKDLAGTYIVSGLEPNNPYSKDTITNQAIEISKTGKTDLTVNFSFLPLGKPLKLKWDDGGGDLGYAYSSYEVNNNEKYQVGILFYKHDQDSIFINYHFQADTPSVVYHYVLTGRKRR